MIYIKWLCLVVLGLIVDILGLVVVPIALLSAPSLRFSRLPKWAWWWDNDAEPYGDVKRMLALGHATSRLQVLWLRFHWLAIRNPSNNFGYYVLGVMQSANNGYGYRGNPMTSDQGEGGILFIKMFGLAGRVVAFELYVVVPYGSRCLRIRLGWKIAHNQNVELWKQNWGKPAQLVCVVNPFMPFTGRRI